MENEHTPVLLHKVLATLAIKPAGTYVDATFGRGGHSAAIVERLNDDGRLIGLDRDPEAIAAGRERFATDARVTLIKAPFAQLTQVLREPLEGQRVDGILLDIGVSSPQLDRAQRGFSFVNDGPLDMRMDPEGGMSAADWLATASERDISAVIFKFGEERFGKRIARAIVAARETAPLTTTLRLAKIVEDAVPTTKSRIHKATRTFQAIRIHINRELEQLEQVLPQCIDQLKPQGRCVVISFHSLEDRIVKRFFRRAASVDPVLAGLPVVPPDAMPKVKLAGKRQRADEAEIAANRRARSATLRAIEKLA